MCCFPSPTCFTPSLLNSFVTTVFQSASNHAFTEYVHIQYVDLSVLNPKYLFFRYEAPVAPNLEVLRESAVEAFPTAIVGFAVAFSVAKVYSKKHDYIIDGNQVSYNVIKVKYLLVACLLNLESHSLQLAFNQSINQ